MDAPTLLVPYSREDSIVAKYFKDQHGEKFLANTIDNLEIIEDASSMLMEMAGTSRSPTQVSEQSIDTSRVYYVNLTPENSGPYRRRIIELQQNVDDFRSFGTGWVAKMMSSFGQSVNFFNSAFVGNMRAQMLDLFFTQIGNGALNRVTGSSPNEVLNAQDPAFHINILRTAMDGLSIGPLSDLAFTTLDQVIINIVRDLKRATEGIQNSSRQYFVLVTVYILNRATGNISCELRTVNFLSTHITKEVADGKNSTRTYREVRVEFSVEDYNFNEAGWLQVKANNEVLIEQGRDLMKDDPQYDVPVN